MNKARRAWRFPERAQFGATTRNRSWQSHKDNSELGRCHRAAGDCAADGFRAWRKAHARAWPIGAISANVITPDYFPYYGSAYSYNGPNYDPIPYRCWRWRHGYRYWIC